MIETNREECQKCKASRVTKACYLNGKAACEVLTREEYIFNKIEDMAEKVLGKQIHFILRKLEAQIIINIINDLLSRIENKTDKNSLMMKNSFETARTDIATQIVKSEIKKD